jgi:uncharacterized membrane protein HdeD (DUF308 family)
VQVPIPSLQQSWRTLMARAVIAILVGLFALLDPHGLWLVLAVLFAYFAICDGLLHVVVGWRETPRAWFWVALGVFELGMGLWIAFRPGIALSTFMVFLGVWAVIRGLLEIQLGLILRRTVPGEFWLIFSGLASVVLGVLLFLQPTLGLVATSWLFGGYAVLAGLLGIVLALKVRRIAAP